MKNTESENESKLLSTAFRLFTENGVKDTTIQHIVDGADVGKGTFYHYFKDKYEIRDILIEKKSRALFNDAIKALNKTDIKNLTEQITFICDFVIDSLKNNKLLLKFISKNLSWGVFSETLSKIYEKTSKEENGLQTLFLKRINELQLKIANPKVTLHMIIELISATAFNSILYNEPLPIEEYKPYLHKAIAKLLEI